jgi:hypothetical protein
MSDTETTAPQGGGETPEPAAPVITGSTEAPASVSSDAATEPTTEPTEQPKPSRADRRIAALSARLSAGEAERARLAQLVERLQRGEQPQQPQPIPAEWQPVIEREVEARTAQRAAQQARDAFHAAGRAEHADWADKCQSLIDMGADARFAELLVETPEGHKVAAALADEPEELERIARLQSDRARAVELGKFAARLESKPAPPRRAQVSKAPAPIRPVSGSVNAEANPYAMSPQEAVAYFSKLDMESRSRR